MNNQLVPPENETKVLMHSCCAPCSGGIIESMVESGISLTIFFYNPNIHPKKEYEIRKQENIKYSEKNNVPFIDADYDDQRWFKRTTGLENEPERGRRCTVCFDIRFERTATYAKENGFKVFTSSLGISRWKDRGQINRCGERAASLYEGLIYWTYNWRKKGGADRMYSLAKEEKMYKQEYCGCVYSLRDTNQWRRKNDRKRVQIGTEYY